MTEAFAEQRRFIEFVHDHLDTKMDAGFARLERTLDPFIDRWLSGTPPER